ncbi:uncharacterized protein LOC108680531 isoform X2 [Hyalella azteca]|uniref:Uncharacterized protein LOC108680531 isoform X1 n=1 Tax=Hyalella azteca TaxID=294128 RepID=A0A8B7PFD3_HYAAZ|nr:uncharacterized protein LOC108680531 isoform X1 [Hyalella azteca]XP_018024849.1 uncharacterized protein LOC108680531 isoform X2 [Hyalella azteca]
MIYRIIYSLLLASSWLASSASPTSLDSSPSSQDDTKYQLKGHESPRLFTEPLGYGSILQSSEYYSYEAKHGCQCAMFLVTNSEWLPQHKVFATGEQYPVNCSLPSEAHEDCRKACQEENTSVTRVFQLHPEALYMYPPSSATPCTLLPAATATFYQACGEQWSPLPLPSFMHVCCHPETGAPAWCDSIPDELFTQRNGYGQDLGIEDRGLDLEKSPDDAENNEIEGSTKPEKLDNDILSGGAERSWLKYVLNIFGYNSLGEMVQGFDIFSLPQRLRHAVKDYRDEVGMGQCYMEYTTYSIFTKGENPFEAFMRSKRSVSDDPDLSFSLDGEEVDAAVNSAPDEDYRNTKYSSGESKKAQIETIKSLVGSLVNMLDQSESTKRYAVVIRQLLPVVTRVYAAEDPQQAVHTLVSSVLGPYLEKIQTRKPKPGDSHKISEKKDKLKSSKPSIPDPPSLDDAITEAGDDAEPSPISTILLNLVRQYMGIYFNTLTGSSPNKIVNENLIEEKVEDEIRVPSKKPPSRPAASFDWMRLLNLFLGGPGQANPRPTTTKATTTPAPVIDEKKDDVAAAELVRPRDFVDVILEIIRPVFISILGKAPGDSGVENIREISRLSVLGRVDDTVAANVLSPYFCLKTYGVNKAWSLTERTLRSFAASLTPEEIETVRALLA